MAGRGSEGSLQGPSPRPEVSSASPANGSPAPRGAATPPPPRWRRAPVVIGAILVVAVLVIVGILTGAIPGLRSSGSSNTTGPEPESVAVASAAALLPGIPGGPWHLTLALGWSSTYTDALSATTFGDATCPLENGTVPTLVYPGYNGTYFGGDAVGWLLEYNSSAAVTTSLYVFAAHGTAGEVGVLTGPAPTCPIEPYNPSLPSGVIGSRAAAQIAVATKGGQTFVGEFSDANASYKLSFETNTNGVIINDIPIWTVMFTACTHGVGGFFDATVFALNGTVQSSSLTPMTS